MTLSLPANRAKTGQFKPGKSGNPNGRPKGVHSLAMELTNGGRDVLEFYVAVMRGTALPCAGSKKKQYPSVQQRLEAAHALADRALGKPIQRNELSGPNGEAIEQRRVLEVVAVDYRVTAQPLLTDGGE